MGVKELLTCYLLFQIITAKAFIFHLENAQNVDITSTQLPRSSDRTALDQSNISKSHSNGLNLEPNLFIIPRSTAPQQFGANNLFEDLRNTFNFNSQSRCSGSQSGTSNSIDNRKKTGGVVSKSLEGSSNLKTSSNNFEPNNILKYSINSRINSNVIRDDQYKPEAMYIATNNPTIGPSNFKNLDGNNMNRQLSIADFKKFISKSNEMPRTPSYLVNKSPTKNEKFSSNIENPKSSISDKTINDKTFNLPSSFNNNPFVSAEKIKLQKSQLLNNPSKSTQISLSTLLSDYNINSNLNNARSAESFNKQKLFPSTLNYQVTKGSSEGTASNRCNINPTSYSLGNSISVPFNSESLNFVSEYATPAFDSNKFSSVSNKNLMTSIKPNSKASQSLVSFENDALIKKLSNSITNSAFSKSPFASIKSYQCPKSTISPEVITVQVPSTPVNHNYDGISSSLQQSVCENNQPNILNNGPIASCPNPKLLYSKEYNFVSNLNDLLAKSKILANTKTDQSKIFKLKNSPKTVIYESFSPNNVFPNSVVTSLSEDRLRPIFDRNSDAVLKYMCNNPCNVNINTLSEKNIVKTNLNSLSQNNGAPSKGINTFKPTNDVLTRQTLKQINNSTMNSKLSQNFNKKFPNPNFSDIQKRQPCFPRNINYINTNKSPENSDDSVSFGKISSALTQAILSGAKSYVASEPCSEPLSVNDQILTNTASVINQNTYNKNIASNVKNIPTLYMKMNSLKNSNNKMFSPSNFKTSATTSLPTEKPQVCNKNENTNYSLISFTFPRTFTYINRSPYICTDENKRTLSFDNLSSSLIKTYLSASNTDIPCKDSPNVSANSVNFLNNQPRKVDSTLQYIGRNNLEQKTIDANYPYVNFNSAKNQISSYTYSKPAVNSYESSVMSTINNISNTFNNIPTYERTGTSTSNILHLLTNDKITELITNEIPYSSYQQEIKLNSNQIPSTLDNDNLHSFLSKCDESSTPSLSSADNNLSLNTIKESSLLNSFSPEFLSFYQESLNKEFAVPDFSSYSVPPSPMLPSLPVSDKEALDKMSDVIKISELFDVDVSKLENSDVDNFINVACENNMRDN